MGYTDKGISHGSIYGFNGQIVGPQWDKMGYIYICIYSINKNLNNTKRKVAPPFRIAKLVISSLGELTMVCRGYSEALLVFMAVIHQPINWGAAPGEDVYLCPLMSQKISSTYIIPSPAIYIYIHMYIYIWKTTWNILFVAPIFFFTNRGRVFVGDFLGFSWWS